MTDPILVIIEYVPYGDLLGYLRKSRGLNDTYFKDPDVKPQTSLTSQQLMKFSWHVAEGMRYLSSKNVSLTLKFSNFFRRNYHFMYLQCSVDYAGQMILIALSVSEGDPHQITL